MYTRCHYDRFDYTTIENGPKSTKYCGKYKNGNDKFVTYSEYIITVDSETSKSKNKDEKANHVCLWTLTIATMDDTICTLWGRKPSELVNCLALIRRHVSGQKVLMYIHNLPYDYVFFRKFLYERFGLPERQLNVKPLYPVSIEFNNGLILRDSLAIAQRKLEKWAIDLDVEHKKAVGKWNYTAYRNVNYEYSEDELEYAEFDTRALAECIRATAKGIGVKMKDMPYTCTGIVRREVQKIGSKNHAHETFFQEAPTFEIYKQLERCYSGGYTHAHRDAIDILQFNVTCQDFASSYPFVMMTGRIPVGKFVAVKDCNIERIIRMSYEYGYIFDFVARDIELKNTNEPMPAIQYARCEYGINMDVDNGRVIKADMVKVPMTEQDLLTINEQYDIKGFAIAINVKRCKKDYLPKWLRDYVWTLWEAKCALKNGDPVLYALAKSKLNSCYGMCVEKWTKFNIVEDYEEGCYKFDKDIKEEDIFAKHIENKKSVLQYQWGIWISAIARRNLFVLGKCINPNEDGFIPWLYSDTDSIYSNNWNEVKLKEYNDRAKQALIDAGYGAVEVNNKEFWLGVATFDGFYPEFKTLGCKKYACITEDGHVKITVAGVNKKGGAKFLERAGKLCKCDPLNFFKPGLVFKGKTTGKNGHSYVFRHDIIIDEDGNEIGDSIDLVPCDYNLSRGEVVNIESSDFDFEKAMEYISSIDLGVKIYGEED